MTPTRRTRRPDGPNQYRQVLDEYEQQGYDITDLGDATTTLRYRDHGGVVAHLLLFLFVGWWTLGLANLAYALWRRHATKDVVEVERV